MLGHLHSDGSHLLTVLADHLLDDVGEVVILRLAHNVKESLHHWPDKGGDVLFGCGGGDEQRCSTPVMLLKKLLRCNKDKVLRRRLERKAAYLSLDC